MNLKLLMEFECGKARSNVKHDRSDLFQWKINYYISEAVETNIKHKSSMDSSSELTADWVQSKHFQKCFNIFVWVWI